jgi:CUB/sushi domain-containing protein
MYSPSVENITLPFVASAVNCGYPGYLANGYVIGQSYMFGDLVSYECKAGFKLVSGDRIQRCSRDGSWSGTKPQCKGPSIII